MVSYTFLMQNLGNILDTAPGHDTMMCKEEYHAARPVEAEAVAAHPKR
jgi:hypothetical protein